MKPKKLMSLSDIVEHLAQWLPDDQQAFKGTPPYHFLCEAVYRVLKANADDRPEQQQALKHARRQFEEYCNFFNEEYERSVEANRIEQERRCEKIEQMLNGPKLRDCGWGSI